MGHGVKMVHEVTLQGAGLVLTMAVYHIGFTATRMEIQKQFGSKGDAIAVKIAIENNTDALIVFGNLVENWVKQEIRIALESTYALLEPKERRQTR